MDEAPGPNTEGSAQYDQLLLLEDLESLREEMEEIGVGDLDEVRRWLDAPAADRRAGAPVQAERVALQSILQLLEEYSLTTRAELEERIAALHAELDAVGG